MAMRLTDTEKWDDDWFLGLPATMKPVWEFIRDNCDGSGFEKISFTKMSGMIGAQVTREDFDRHFSERVHWLSADRFWIAGFVPGQWKQLSPRAKEFPKFNIAHFNMIKKIRSELYGQELRGKVLVIFNHLETIYRAWSEDRASLGRGSDEDRAKGKKGRGKGITEKEEKEILSKVFSQEGAS